MGGAHKSTESMTDAGQCRGHTQRETASYKLDLLYRPITVKTLGNLQKAYEANCFGAYCG